MARLSDIHAMHIKDIDLNLLRLFEAVYRLRSVSRAAEALDLSQPAASQALTRLRLLLSDPLFVRAPGGVRPTPRAERLAQAVQAAIGLLSTALNEAEHFNPAVSPLRLRLHLSDIGEARFLPALMQSLREQAPRVQVSSRPWPADEVADALDTGRVDFALGFLPGVQQTQRVELLRDRYCVLLRAGHPLAGAKPTTAWLRRLDFVAVATHSETLRILQQLQLQDRLRLTSSNFLALPDIVKRTDLAALMPHNIAREFFIPGEHALLLPSLPQGHFSVALHWSRRFEADPAHRWARGLLLALFKSA
jgi:DNA-binding transcriptional LysR family regulator